MKKIIILGLILILVLTLLLGCSKDETEKPDGQDTSINTKEDTEESGDKDNTEEVKSIDYVIYLRHKTLPIISAEKYSINEDNERLKQKSIEEIALEDLISFEGIGDLISPVPKETKILSIIKKDSIVFVDLSKEFKDNMQKDEINTRIAVASIVNTLLTLDGNEKVIFTIEGQEISEINGVKMDGEFEFIDDYIPNK